MAKTKKAKKVERKPLPLFAPKVAAERAKTLSDYQKKVYVFIRKHEQVTLAEIAKACFGYVRAKDGDKRPPRVIQNSWTRNQLRQLRQCRLVKKVDRGTYAAA